MSVGGLPLIGAVARDGAALLCRGEACLLARTLDAFCLDGARNPAQILYRAPAKVIALYFYGIILRQSEGLASGRVGHKFYLFLHDRDANGCLKAASLPASLLVSMRHLSLLWLLHFYNADGASKSTNE